MIENFNESHMFALDRVFDSTVSMNNPEPASQQTVFESLGYDALCLAWGGVNTSIFAYGQTGSGKVSGAGSIHVVLRCHDFL